MDENVIKIIFQIIIDCDIVFKIFIIFIGIKRLLKIRNDMKIDNKYLSYIGNSKTKINAKNKWTFWSMSKFIINKLIFLIYISLIIICIINDTLWNNGIIIIDLIFFKNYIFYIYSIICCITWLISTRLFYKEYRIYRDQAWYGIRTFWIVNSVISIFKIILFFILVPIDNINDSKNIIFLILTCFIYFLFAILSSLAIFHPYDVLIEKTFEKKKSGNLITENNPQEELVSNSIEDEIENESEISMENYNNILIEFPNNEQLGNNKQFSLELNIKTLDFYNLIFILKIQNIRYKKEKKSLFVCNFNEVIIKYYKNKNSPKELLNLLKQAYNISLSINPQRNSFNANKKDVSLLAHLYIEIIKVEKGFLLDLIKFLKIEHDDIINTLSNYYTSIYDDKPLIEKDIERMDSLRSIFNDESGFTDTSHSSNKKKSIDEKRYNSEDIKENSNKDSF
jgi:hypothetical protein